MNATANRLDKAATWTLGKWLEAHQEELRAANMKCPAIAQRASAELGFPVNANNIMATRVAIGVRVGEYKEPKPPKPVAPKPASMDDVAYIANRLLEIRHARGMLDDPRLRMIANGSPQRPLGLEG